MLQFLKLKLIKNSGDSLKILISNSWSLSSFNIIPLEVKHTTSFSKFNEHTYLF